jgi:hypothetical protein
MCSRFKCRSFVVEVEERVERAKNCGLPCAILANQRDRLPELDLGFRDSPELLDSESGNPNISLLRCWRVQPVTNCISSE